MQKLDELATKYGTDKGPLANGYTKYYEIYLDAYRDFQIYKSTCIICKKEKPL